MYVWIVILSFSFLFCSSFGSIRFCEKSCPSNEVFAFNVSHCKNTCYNRNFNLTANCRMGPGCVCQQGFIRHQDTYKCIPVGTCSDKRYHKQCADNEFWSDCDAGCQSTCQTRGSKLSCGCISGCACRTGFVRNFVDFQCISESLCQSCPQGYSYSSESKKCVWNCQMCKTNETYKSCGSCERTCGGEPSSSCSQRCSEGCFCKQGFARNAIDGSCVLSTNCPKCPENESFKCGNPLCETNCQMKCTKFPKKCKNKCYCDKGYVRALEGGQCVSVDHCPIINT